jgi:hypothetical protein
LEAGKIINLIQEVINMELMKRTPIERTWITVITMVLVAASMITQPFDLKGMLPVWLTNPIVSGFSVINLAAFLLLFCAYWVAAKKTA